MNLGALIDLGADCDYVIGGIKRLAIGSCQIQVVEDSRKGIKGKRVDVLFHHEPGGIHECSHGHRSFKDIKKSIEESLLSAKVKETSLGIFKKLAEAEGKIHGRAVDDVHFHEVGAADSIVDIVGAALCLEYLQVDRILSSPVQVGGGFVTCAHGILPVPAPATAEILRGIPIRTGSVPFETTTPTGAAILAATVDRFTEEVSFTPARIGYGIGRRDTDIPNVLRVFMGEMKDEAVDSDVEVRDACLIECNIDDMNPEIYEPVLDMLFEKGALDVHLTPVIMKKSRPAVKISILCGAERLKEMEEILWLNTTTFGIRISKITKKMLLRDFERKTTKFGEISFKNAYLHGRKIKSKPEYEDIKKLARERNVGIKEIYDSLPSEDV